MAGATVFDFWKDVCTKKCVLCGKTRKGPYSKKRWRGKYCSKYCRESVRQAFRDVWLKDRSNFSRRGNAYRAMWIPRYGPRTTVGVFFDFATEEVLDDRAQYGREIGDWRPIECSPGYKCKCGQPAVWASGGAWCRRCWRKFAWVPSSRLSRFLPSLAREGRHPAPYEAMRERSWQVIATTAAKPPAAAGATPETIAEPAKANVTPTNAPEPKKTPLTLVRARLTRQNENFVYSVRELQQIQRGSVNRADLLVWFAQQEGWTVERLEASINAGELRFEHWEESF